MKTAAHSLEELGGVKLAPPPETTETELTLTELGLNLEDLKARAQKIIKEAKKIREWVRSTVGQLEALNKEPREVRELVEGEMIKAQEGLAELLNHKTPAFRRAAWLGLLGYKFSKNLASRKEVEELISWLTKKGRLVEGESRNGLSLTAYKKAYAVNPNSCFGPEEMAEIRMIFGKLLSRVFEEIGKAREATAQELQTQATISMVELVAGRAGKCVLVVPGEKDAQSGKWRGGGVLLVESNGQDIRPLDASGTIERIIDEARGLKVFLKVHTLAPSWLRPPVVPGITEEMVKKIQLLWYLIKRAIRAEEEAARLAKAKEGLASRATVAPAEFFLDQKPGICLAEFHGTWANPDGSPGPSNFFFLVERKEEEGVKRIRIAAVPSHLGDFFAQCTGEYPEEGDKFKGLPYPLIAVLQAIYGQTLQASQDADKAGQIAN